MLSRLFTSGFLLIYQTVDFPRSFHIKILYAFRGSTNYVLSTLEPMKCSSMLYEAAPQVLVTDSREIFKLKSSFVQTYNLFCDVLRHCSFGGILAFYSRETLQQ